MPAARHRSRSSLRERAVKAMTGKCPPASRSRSRMAWMTWKPSRSGMWRSRSNRSKSPSFAKDSASLPLFASRTRWPRRTSNCSKSCALSSLSSATRMRSGLEKDKEARSGGDKETEEDSLPFSLSPCLLVSLSLEVRLITW